MGPGLGAETNKLCRALQEAVSHDDIEGVRSYLPAFTASLQKTKPSATTARVCTSLLGSAAESNAAAVVQYLIEQGGNVNVHQALAPDKRDPKGSYLHHALYYSAVEAARVLINAGADLKVRGYDSDTPLHYALRHCSDPEIIDLLLEKGADIHVHNGNGISAYKLGQCFDDKFGEFIDGFPARQKEKQRKAAWAREARLCQDGLPEDMTVKPPVRVISKKGVRL